LEDTVTRCTGLVTQYNPLNVQPGALILADNAIVRRENIIEDRRGYAVYGALSNNATALLTFLSRVIAHNGTKVSYDDGAGTGNYLDYTGAYTAPSDQKMRFVEAFSNLYATTNVGIQVFTDVAGTAARKAGAPRSLDPSYILNAASSGFLPTSSQCAYRVVLLRTDSNDNNLYGYPSQRLWVTNSTGSSKNVDLTLFFPSEMASADATQYTVQVYRTQHNSGGGVASDSAGDEMGLVYEYTPTSSDITTGFVTFTDSVDNSLVGTSLYTSPSQETITGANERPPLSKDMALYKSVYMFYANTATKQRLSPISVVGTQYLGVKTTGTITSGSNQLTTLASTNAIVTGMTITGTGIPAGTTVSSIVGTTVTMSANATASTVGVSVTFVTPATITIAGTTYSFAAAEDTSTGKVGVSVTGTAAVDIALTAQSIVRVINRYATNTTVYAYYISDANGLPGKIMLEERSVGGSAFTIQVSASAIQGSFSPQPPISPATKTACTSKSQIQKNAVYFSKAQQPEAVPALNYLLVGPANKAILRIAALRDSLIVIKEEGIYRITGENPQSFTVSILDNTVFCKAADSVAVLANQVWMLSNQGVVAISDTNVQVVSREIEPNILPLLTYGAISTATTGAGYESDRTYLLSTITSSGDTVQNQTFVYNYFTRTWTRYTFGFNAAIVDPATDKLFFSKPGVANVYRERKNFDNSDYCDPESTITVTAINGDYVSFTISGGQVPSDGWVIQQGFTQIPIVSLQATLGVYTALLESTPPASWTTGAATIFPNVGMEVIWDAWGGGNFGLLKQVSEFCLLADNIPGNSTATSLIATFTSNTDEDRDEVTIAALGQGWGGAWGTIAWGGGSDSYGYRTWVPRNKQMCRVLNPGFKHTVAFQKVSIAGYALKFEVLSERTTR
jgi:hypothetical protein